MRKIRKARPSLLSYTDQLVETIRKTAPDAIKTGNADAVHATRVATRRMNAAIDAFKPITGNGDRKELTKILKKLRKSLGPVRDIEVMLGHLTEIKPDPQPSQLEWLRQQWLKEQAKAKKNAAAELDPARVLARLGSWFGLRQQWAEADESGLHLLLAESMHLQLDRFIEHADALSGRGTVTDQKDLLDPHQLRIAGKSLRYTLELAAAGGRKLPAAVLRSFKRMQDDLGLWHDYVVLNDRLLHNAIGHRDATAVLTILDLAKVTVRRSQRHLEKFSTHWNQQGEQIARSIREMVPLTQPVESAAPIESKTDLDPAERSAPVEDLQAPHSQDEISIA